jgi:hypothetical protein
MATGRISLESTLLGTLLIGASYQVITFTAVGGRKLRVLSSLENARGYVWPSCGMVAMRSKELPVESRRRAKQK